MYDIMGQWWYFMKPCWFHLNVGSGWLGCTSWAKATTLGSLASLIDPVTWLAGNPLEMVGFNRKITELNSVFSSCHVWLPGILQWGAKEIGLKASQAKLSQAHAGKPVDFGNFWSEILGYPTKNPSFCVRCPQGGAPVRNRGSVGANNYNVRPPFDSVQLVNITPITMVYGTQITN